MSYDSKHAESLGDFSTVTSISTLTSAQSPFKYTEHRNRAEDKHKILESAGRQYNLSSAISPKLALLELSARV